jgi:hypothetical protein
VPIALFLVIGEQSATRRWVDGQFPLIWSGVRAHLRTAFQADEWGRLRVADRPHIGKYDGWPPVAGWTLDTALQHIGNGRFVQTMILR